MIYKKITQRFPSLSDLLLSGVLASTALGIVGGKCGDKKSLSDIWRDVTTEVKDSKDALEKSMDTAKSQAIDAYKNVLVKKKCQELTQTRVAKVTQGHVSRLETFEDKIDDKKYGSLMQEVFPDTNNVFRKAASLDRFNNAGHTGSLGLDAARCIFSCARDIYGAVSNVVNREQVLEALEEAKKIIEENALTNKGKNTDNPTLDDDLVDAADNKDFKINVVYYQNQAAKDADDFKRGEKSLGEIIRHIMQGSYGELVESKGSLKKLVMSQVNALSSEFKSAVKSALIGSDGILQSCDVISGSPIQGIPDIDRVCEVVKPVIKALSEGGVHIKDFNEKAAKAGKDGVGFAEIRDEIDTLIKEINNAIKDINYDTVESAVEAATDPRDLLYTNVRPIVDNIKKLKEVKGALDTTHKKAEEEIEDVDGA